MQAEEAFKFDVFAYWIFVVKDEGENSGFCFFNCLNIVWLSQKQCRLRVLTPYSCESFSALPGLVAQHLRVHNLRFQGQSLWLLDLL